MTYTVYTESQVTGGRQWQLEAINNKMAEGEPVGSFLPYKVAFNITCMENDQWDIMCHVTYTLKNRYLTPSTKSCKAPHSQRSAGTNLHSWLPSNNQITHFGNSEWRRPTPPYNTPKRITII